MPKIVLGAGKPPQRRQREKSAREILRPHQLVPVRQEQAEFLHPLERGPLFEATRNPVVPTQAQPSDGLNEALASVWKQFQDYREANAQESWAQAVHKARRMAGEAQVPLAKGLVWALGRSLSPSERELVKRGYEHLPKGVKKELSNFNPLAPGGLGADLSMFIAPRGARGVPLERPIPASSSAARLSEKTPLSTALEEHRSAAEQPFRLSEFDVRHRTSEYGPLSLLGQGGYTGTQAGGFARRFGEGPLARVRVRSSRPLDLRNETIETLSSGRVRLHAQDADNIARAWADKETWRREGPEWGDAHEQAWNDNYDYARAHLRTPVSTLQTGAFPFNRTAGYVLHEHIRDLAAEHAPNEPGWLSPSSRSIELHTRHLLRHAGYDSVLSGHELASTSEATSWQRNAFSPRAQWEIQRWEDPETGRILPTPGANEFETLLNRRRAAEANLEQRGPGYAPEGLDRLAQAIESNRQVPEAPAGRESNRGPEQLPPLPRLDEPWQKAQPGPLGGRTRIRGETGAERVDPNYQQGAATIHPVESGEQWYTWQGVTNTRYGSNSDAHKTFNLKDASGQLLGSIEYEILPRSGKLQVGSAYLDKRAGTVENFMKLMQPAIEEGRPIEAMFANRDLNRLFRIAHRRGIIQAGGTGGAPIKPNIHPAEYAQQLRDKGLSEAQITEIFHGTRAWRQTEAWRQRALEQMPGGRSTSGTGLAAQDVAERSGNAFLERMLVRGRVRGLSESEVNNLWSLRYNVRRELGEQGQGGLITPEEFTEAGSDLLSYEEGRVESGLPALTREQRIGTLVHLIRRLREGVPPIQRFQHLDAHGPAGISEQELNQLAAEPGGYSAAEAQEDPHGHAWQRMMNEAEAETPFGPQRPSDAPFGPLENPLQERYRAEAEAAADTNVRNYSDPAFQARMRDIFIRSYLRARTLNVADLQRWNERRNP